MNEKIIIERPRHLTLGGGAGQVNHENILDYVDAKFAALEVNSHPPIDLRPAIVEILSELGYPVKPAAPVAEQAPESLEAITKDARSVKGTLWEALINWKNNGGARYSAIDDAVAALLVRAYAAGQAAQWVHATPVDVTMTVTGGYHIHRPIEEAPIEEAPTVASPAQRACRGNTVEYSQVIKRGTVVREGIVTRVDPSEIMDCRLEVDGHWVSNENIIRIL